MTGIGTVTIAPELVPYLRRGVKRELSATLEILSDQVDVALDRAICRNALARFDGARDLFDVVCLVDDEGVRPEPLELDLERYAPPLVLRVLESEYDAELMRLQDRAQEGFALALREVPALGRLVDDVRKIVGVSPRPRPRILGGLAPGNRGRRGSS